MSDQSNEQDLRTWRLYALAASATGCMIVLVAKLFYIQVIQHDYYRTLAAKEHWRREEIPARRGTIRDRSGQPLAVSVAYESLYANTAQIGDPAQVAARLAPVIGEPVAQIAEKLKVKSSAPTLLKRRLPAEIADRVRALRLWNVYLVPEPVRAHPLGRTANQLLGVTGVDGKGLSGLELAFESDLAGKPGWVLAERDTGGDEIVFGPRESEPPVDGADLVLTIDQVIQHIAERELDAALARWKAPSGTVIVMQPKTGAILAMASRPAFDPNQYEKYAQTPEIFVNPAVGRLYEPGSTFKIITVAAALDSGRATPRTTYLDKGVAVYGGWTLRNWDGRAHGVSTLADLLRYSSNVGAAHVAYNLLGKDLFYDYVRRFGFGAPTGIGLQGVVNGLIKDPASPGWYPVDLATNSYGQGISVTPLQLIAAVSAVANDGLLMRPYVVQKIISPTETRETKPAAVRQVISPQTARTVREMLVGVVENGETRYAMVPGYRVAGKTGTASIPTPNGRYESDATIASFVGMLPADDPQVVILVKIDRPQEEPWGSIVAAPVFKNIAQEVATYLRIPPSQPAAPRR